MILDTHVWIWWLGQNGKLPQPMRKRIEAASSVAVSAASVYEVALAVARNRLTLTLAMDDWLRDATEGADIAVAAIDSAIAKRAAQLPQVHGDPLDRIIIATALVRNARLLSLDGKFGGYEALQGVLMSA
jgi:PIN domain nuclease of toxin-antitoxin system